MLKKLCFVSLISASFAGSAGQLIINATVIAVANTYDGNANFTIKLQGGTGPCANVPWVVFPESKKQSADSYKQLFSIALVALTSGRHVRVHNFLDNSCFGADFIEINQ